jgi:uncharacterized Zn finger protein (UPF0148 family)
VLNTLLHRWQRSLGPWLAATLVLSCASSSASVSAQTARSVGYASGSLNRPSSQIMLVRAGGGHTFSGGHSSGHSIGHSSGAMGSIGRTHSGSGGGAIGGCGCLVVIFIIVLIIVILLIAKRKGWLPTPSSTPSAPPPPAAVDLDAIRSLDPEFSVVLFEDFAYALYARAHEARNKKPDLDALAPYLSEAARADLERRPPVGAPVTGVIVGSMHAAGLWMPTGLQQGGDPQQVRVLLEFESNMTVGPDGAQRTQYVKERWHLARNANVRTKPPEAVRSFHCPNCGAPFESTGNDRCQYCGEVVSGGRFDWSVLALELGELEDRPPTLTGTTEEEGNDLPNIEQPQLAERHATLLADDPTATDAAVSARLKLIYDEINAGWSALDLSRARAYVSDSLFGYLQYWIQAYQHQGLRNVLEGMTLVRSTLVKVVRDKHYDSLTFRIWGTGHDYTVRQSDGGVVGGNPRSNRNYSEYWTVIRGATVKGAPRTDQACPNCGAPLAVNMAGECEHCGANITQGNFDWVLSKIEQDESYVG